MAVEPISLAVDGSDNPDGVVPLGLPKRFMRNVGTNYAVTAAGALTTLIVTPIILHKLGVAALGVWILGQSVVGYLELLKFGFGGATTKLIAEDANRRPERVTRTLNTNFAVLSVLGVLSLVVGAIVAANAPSWFDVSGDLAGETIIVIALLTISLAISIPCDTFGGALSGYQRYDLSGLANLLLVGISGILSIIVVQLGGGLVPLAIVTLVISVAMHGVRWRMVKSLVPQMRLSRRLVERDRIPAIARLSGWFTLGGFAYTAGFKTDLVVIGAILGVKDVAIFAIGLKLSQLASKGVDQLAAVFMPHAAALHKDGDKRSLSALLIDGTRTTMIVGIPVILLCIFLAPQIVRVWVGPGYAEAAQVLIVLSAFQLLWVLVSAAELVVIGCDRVRAWALVAAVQAVLNLGLSVVLVATVGLVGAAIGTLVSSVAIVPPLLYLACRESETPIPVFFRRAVLPHVLPAAGLIVSSLVLSTVSHESRLGLLFTGAVACLTYGVLYLFLGATAHERTLVRSVVLRRRSTPVPVSEQ